MDINQIENNIEALLSSFTEENFIYGLLAAYGLPNAAITRLRNGEYNLSKNKNQILWKKRVCYLSQKNVDLHSAIDELKKSPAISKQHPRFLIVTDFTTLLAIDTENSDSLDIPLKDLSRHFDFFLPWAGMEKSQLQRENPADIKAAERMGRLYDLILEENPIESEEHRHSLNVFFTRLLFCYFAEDTGIFPSGIFVNGIASHTSEDGSDLQSYLTKVFETLNQKDRGKCPAFLTEYPYVNGGLFASSSPVPRFNAKSRKILIDCGALNWKAINPDIFGSMMQAVVHSNERSGKGMHYTSVVNIMKVIEPLFLNDLREELERAGNNKQKLEKLLERIYHLRIFDPACGSGNFLIIAYKELCKLEIEVFKRLNHSQMSFRFQNKLKINQFYGIEIDDFAHETAKLSLWLAEHQMNLHFRDIFGEARPTLPLQDCGNITCTNALQNDWKEFCPRDDSRETYILGNPPYVGYSERTDSQKDDMNLVFGSADKGKRLDYIACWFKKAADYIQSYNSSFAFVSTNSLCQGEQVSLIWPYVLSKNLEIYFAHQSFAWTNNAKGKAGVTCVIVGVQNKKISEKKIYSITGSKIVKNINPYLIEGSPTVMEQRTFPISDLPEMVLGSTALDGGSLTLTAADKKRFTDADIRSARFIKPFISGGDLLQGGERFCLWIEDEYKQLAESIPLIKERIFQCQQFRMHAGRDGKKAASVPHRFYYRKFREAQAVVVPKTSSGRRRYLPVGMLNIGTVVSEGAFVIYNSEPYIFGILSSRMHSVWMSITSARLRTDFRYSVNLTYNTFPLPTLSTANISAITEATFKVLDAREANSEKTLSELYDPDKMPNSLLIAHQKLDTVFENVYRSKPFDSDDERLEYLFQFYEKMSQEKKFNESNYA